MASSNTPLLKSEEEGRKPTGFVPVSAQTRKFMLLLISGGLLVFLVVTILLCVATTKSTYCYDDTRACYEMTVYYYVSAFLTLFGGILFCLVGCFSCGKILLEM